ncbi:MAG: gamma-glutamyltransferase, partial [Burkholderiales bacterium]
MPCRGADSRLRSACSCSRHRCGFSSALCKHAELIPMKGVVVCPQPRAADVGAAILAKGGNAFDAAVATAFSQMVNDPFMCGIGGMGT